jgi:hypothetical protein
MRHLTFIAVVLAVPASAFAGGEGGALRVKELQNRRFHRKTIPLPGNTWKRQTQGGTT